MPTGTPLVRHHLTLHGLGRVQVVMHPSPTPGSPMAVISGTVGTAEPVLVRLQSSCVYGEVLGSHDCDCRAQLDKAMGQIMENGSGVLVYLNQEGRSAGLLTKACGYALVENGGATDSFAAYEELGVQPDQRDYSGAAALLHELGITHVRLLTNNPAKIAGLEAAGIAVERVPHQVAPSESNGPYLESKRRRGHLLEPVAL